MSRRWSGEVMSCVSSRYGSAFDGARIDPSPPNLLVGDVHTDRVLWLLLNELAGIIDFRSVSAFP
jgi:hypothetical protein